MEEKIIKNNTAAKKKTAKIKKTLFKAMSKKVKIGTVIVVAGVLFVVGFLLFSPNKEGQVTTISKASLQKIIEISELSTVEYTYNATATQYVEDNTEDVKYYVAYEGTVTAGIDFQEIDINVEKDEKIVFVTIPEVEIHGVSIDMGTLEYIFVKKKFETETISHEAYKLCKDDLKKRIEKEELLYETARENAISSVEAMIKPWVESIDSEFRVEIK